MVAMPGRRILELGDPLLRTISEPVSSASEARLILRDLRATLHEFRRTHGFGRGISAVQIGELKRIIYLEFDGLPYCLINPSYERQSAEKLRLWDDCFSFPNLLVYLERSLSVSVRYLDRTGAAQRLEASGALSELLQHEMDHLDGILAIDRALDRHSFATRSEFERRFAAPKLTAAGSWLPV
jgi:peptide deformylase